jgi:capsular exopolysaccharide synthesis family protein
MTRVFEALRREQERKKKESTRDPLAAATGAPGEGTEDAAAEFELPSVIGSPVPPRPTPSTDDPSRKGPNPGLKDSSPTGVSAPARPESSGSGAPAPDAGAGRADGANGTPFNGSSGAPVGSALDGPSGRFSPSPGLDASTRTTANGTRANSPARGNATGEITPPDQPSYAESGAVSDRGASRTVGDIRSRQTEMQRLREELSFQAVTRAAREIPIERLVMSRLHQRLIVATEPSAAECEQYRTLRTQLFHAAEKKQTQVVVITSALPGEGKTSTALNLALAIAQSKESRILVIDGDLRRPNIGSYLGMRSKVGLGEVLKGEANPLDAVVCLDEPELYVMPISHEADNPTELLSSERLVEMIAELRDYFDFILIDSPPVMPFADSRLLSNHSDAVILVIRAEKAPYETVEKAVEVLPPGRILGVVLNDAQHIRETDYYDYYYSYTQREQRRRSLLGKLSSRVRDSWLGKKMKL